MKIINILNGLVRAKNDLMRAVHRRSSHNLIDLEHFWKEEWNKIVKICGRLRLSAVSCYFNSFFFLFFFVLFFLIEFNWLLYHIKSKKYILVYVFTSQNCSMITGVCSLVFINCCTEYLNVNMLRGFSGLHTFVLY